jgi:hypothetical protein
MSTLEQLTSALQKADAAGNVEDARIFASEIRKLKATPIQQQTPISAQQTQEPRDISGQGILMGIKDPINAGAQFISRNVPPSVNEAIDVKIGRASCRERV